MDLIPRILYQSSGKIIFDGKSSHTFSINGIREKIAYVPQEVNIHDSSIYENICLGTETHTEKEILGILEQVGLSGFVKQLPERMNTLLGQMGQKISGGQKQRIGIARAVAKGADIVLLDEPTSNLDPENTNLIANLLKRLASEQNKTIIVATHDWELISNFDVM